ncbi:thiaminase II [Salipaludibacillus sp. LMS25]|jgi:thiaminase/transcriptional activator TenA|uniref:thiaminase II n=1 Tax=Salipaludibacillus sp. LMS25 TaxID=2924031 RepID=UPI0020D00A28|nr:thiaminase II [Salipaludibacillus sp. LMS25]UTR14166.1 thiaminase II [Salipaludibacillus sp. LMS25]
MSFTSTLRKETNHLFDACYQHPFVQGIGKGELSKDQLIHYVKQDFEYLNAMIQTRAYTMAKCTSRDKMAFLNEGISFILSDETHPHHNFCDVAGVNYEALQGENLAPNAHHYSCYMLQVSQSGSLGEALAVALPCPWIYLDIGERLMNEIKPDKSHPFYPWISFYGTMDKSSLTETLSWLDELAEEAGKAECDRMRHHFVNGCKMEYMFFDMAYKQQAWPV